MRLSALMAVTLVAHESMVLSRPQTTRREVGGLNGDFRLLDNGEEMTIPPDEPDVVYPSSAYDSPRDPYIVSMDQASINNLQPETSDTDTTSEKQLITDLDRQSFDMIKSRICQYGVYELSPDKHYFQFKYCGQSSYWKDLSDSISQAKPGFVLCPLGKRGILSIRNLYKENSQESALAITTNEDAWLDALIPVFGHVIAVGYVFDQKSLADLMYRFFIPSLPSPSYWILPGP
ncbi:hypothetical protein MMC22_010040 [Lobaria immixta]|nr:hypothetical protein [Lobaria immixta]